MKNLLDRINGRSKKAKERRESTKIDQNKVLNPKNKEGKILKKN